MVDYAKDFSEASKASFARLPKQGEPPIVITIKKIEKAVSKNPKFRNFEVKRKIKLPDGTIAEKTEDLGYYIKVTLDNDQELSINNTYHFQNLFVRPLVQEGETIKISHPDKGVWKVERVVKEIQVDEVPF